MSTNNLSVEHVNAAYKALASGDLNQVKEYWAENMRWLVPGHHPLAGWYEGLDGFFGFMTEVGKLSGISFRMDPITIMTNDEYSADVTHNLGFRAGFDETTAKVPFTKLDINVVHVLRWENGKVVEGKGAIYGDGTTNFDQFWGPLSDDETRL